MWGDQGPYVVAEGRVMIPHELLADLKGQLMALPLEEDECRLFMERMTAIAEEFCFTADDLVDYEEYIWVQCVLNGNPDVPVSVIEVAREFSSDSSN